MKDNKRMLWTLKEKRHRDHAGDACRLCRTAGEVFRLLAVCCVLWACLTSVTEGQTISREQLVFYTAEWKGERFPDGRPKVPDDILARLKNVSIEEAWGVLRSHGYHNQFEGGWQLIHDNVPVVGRALTAQYMPARPELAQRILKRGHGEGRVGNYNSWPIDALVRGDVYVADGHAQGV